LLTLFHPVTGGDDFDNVIMEWLMKEHLHRVPDLKSPATVALLKALAEAAKVCTERTAVRPKPPPSRL
jgi:molecular chaperone DnaK (HSP70)